ncbi:MAG: flagellar motor stator protein MotA [Aeromonas sobria]
MLKFGGLMLVLGSILLGFMMAGGAFASLWQPAEYGIILGAGAGAMLLGHDKEVLRAIGHQLKRIFHKHDDAELYREFLLLAQEMLENTKRLGLKFLDEHIDDPLESSVFTKYPQILAEPELVVFMTDNLRLLSMGKVESYELEGLLDKEIEAMRETRIAASRAMNTTAEAMPGFGILAAVLGIVITMGQIDAGIVIVGIKVAAALIGTFFGIFMCYGILAPLAAAMAETVERDINMLYACREVLIAFAAGKSSLMAIDAGRRLVPEKYKPTFAEMEEWLRESKEA